MAEVKGDIVNRVLRLPKPSKATDALQPLFEAVSNAIHAVEDLFDQSASELGRIHVEVTNLSTPGQILITVSDNGIGLADDRFEAFCTTDTNFKIVRGGKGVGRLLWLDAFSNIEVVSVYANQQELKKRKFRFQLTATDQITDEIIEGAPDGSVRGTIVKFSGLRGNSYAAKFPSKATSLISYFGSHFLAEFLSGSSPPVSLSVDDKSANFPDDIQSLVIEDRGKIILPTSDFGDLELASFICKRTASVGFEGSHQLHLVANGRTVSTRKIDGLLGIGRFGDGKYVYHGCVSGKFLDERVNQERTQFNFDEEIAEQIAKVCADSVRTSALKYEVENFDAGRLQTMKEFLEAYPSFGFESAENLLIKTPKNSTKAEQFAQALIPTRIRRDTARQKNVQQIVSSLDGAEPLPENFAVAVRRAADEVRAEEQRQLTEYVLKRKMVLDVLDVLIRRVRETDSGKDDHHLEKTLHQFICPMKIRGNDPKTIESADHDLWIIDERLAFAKYFASDVPISQLVADSASGERPDLLLFDRLHGLGLEGDEPLTRVMLVEFKKPGRESYDERYSPINQISRYLNDLVDGNVESVDRERVRVTKDCVFYCYVIADIVGNLDTHTSTWRTTADGRGRWIELSGKFKGSIEIIEWKDLVKDARARNRAFTHAVGV